MSGETFDVSAAFLSGMPIDVVNSHPSSIMWSTVSWRIANMTTRPTSSDAEWRTRLDGRTKIMVPARSRTSDGQSTGE